MAQFKHSLLGVFALVLFINYSTKAQELEPIIDYLISKPSCTTPPIITCPPDFFSCPGASTSPTNTGVAIGEPGSATCSPPTINFSDLVLSTGPCTDAIDIERTWIATDPDDPTLTSSCIQRITLSDDEKPIISNCPKDTSVRTNSQCFANVSWTPPSVFDNCGKFFLTVSHISGDRFPLGVTTVEYVAEDECGNISTCSFDITVEGSCCTDPPVITCPSDYSGCPGDTILPKKLGLATGVAGGPDCDPPVVTHRDSIISVGPCTGATEVIRIWTATDPFDTTLYSECQQRIVLEDTVAPRVQLCPTDTTIQPDAGCIATYEWSKPIFTDKCGVQSITSTHESGDTFPKGMTVVTITATDGCGQQVTCTFTVTVTYDCCNEPPVIDCSNAFVGCPGISLDPALTGKPAVTKGDPSCADPVLTYKDDTLSSGPCPGALSVKRTWIATDPNDATLADTCVQMIDLIDDQAPTWTNCPLDTTIMSDTLCKAILTWQTPNASDRCGAPMVTSTHPSGDEFGVGTTIVIYTATDDCGNSSTCSFEVTVLANCCDQPPVIDCPSDYTGCPMTPIDPATTGKPTVTKGGPHCGNPQLSYTDDTIQKGPCPGELHIERKWTAVDPNDPDLKATCLQKIDLEDHVKPVFRHCPKDITIDIGNDCETNVHWTPPTATDNCNWFTVTSTHEPGDVFGTGTTTVTYTAEDDCGNVAKCSFKVKIIGKEFKMRCPGDLVIKQPSQPNGHVVHWNQPKLDHCGNNCVDHLPGFMYMGEYNGSRYFCSLSPATWDYAKAICESNGGHLATINDANENDWLHSKLMGAIAWIGLNDKNSEGQFEWADRSNSTYRNWYPGQPNDYNGNQDVVEILEDGRWNDQYGHIKREFICEIKCGGSIEQIAGPPSGSLFPCGRTTVTYVANNGHGLTDTCSFTISVECHTGPNYCKSYGIHSHYTYIDKVQLGHLNHTSGDDGGYADFTNKCADVRNGGTYPICLKPGFRNGIYTVYWRVWIDLNMDGDFDDTGEYIASGHGNKEICGTIQIPHWCLKGTTRMRVSMAYGGYPANPCCVFSYGEVEDYCININGTTITNIEKVNDPIYLTTDIDFNQDINLDLVPSDREPISEIQVYPNPASELVRFTSKSELDEIQILDFSGKIVQTFVQPMNESEYDISELASGAYFVHFVGKNGDTHLEKLIIQ